MISTFVLILHLSLLYVMVKSNPVTNGVSDGCLTVPINQTISIQGCEDYILSNRMCTGYCTSSYVYDPVQKTRVSVCVVCKPETSQKIIFLKCAGKTETKTVEIFETCLCETCISNKN